MTRACKRASWLLLATVLTTVAPRLASGANAPAGMAAGDAGIAAQEMPAAEPPVPATAARDGGETPAAPAPPAVTGGATTNMPPAIMSLNAAPAAPPAQRSLLEQGWFWGAIAVVVWGAIGAYLVTRNPGSAGCPSGFTCE
jgi:hypothetical protein